MVKLTGLGQRSGTVFHGTPELLFPTGSNFILLINTQ